MQGSGEGAGERVVVVVEVDSVVDVVVVIRSQLQFSPSQIESLPHARSRVSALRQKMQAQVDSKKI